MLTGIADNSLLFYCTQFQVTYDRVARGQLHHDRIIFAMLLARIHLKLSARYSKKTTTNNPKQLCSVMICTVMISVTIF